jgi:hypothetical protein
MQEGGQIFLVRGFFSGYLRVSCVLVSKKCCYGWATDSDYEVAGWVQQFGGGSTW